MAFSDFDHVSSFWQGYVLWVADGLLMFRSSVAAFYSLPKWLFYRLADAVPRNRFAILLPRLHVHPQFEAVVHRASQVLLAAEIPLMCCST